ncbi:sensor histidine kinase [Listeria grayi]|uniref:Sensor histidine kinase n=2 Tax=Listeria grayi TaxID=1641 RepID=D7UUJ8_LISGR|nr:sensor histidine kinase [Listeria grayi]EFI84924.1 putative oxygen sensor histidine kinase NreB [Listeria grayi DSM 20601]STY44883.1 Oxygen sensor histidine kinase nreB [Listeria grayi]
MQVMSKFAETILQESHNGIFIVQHKKIIDENDTAKHIRKQCIFNLDNILEVFKGTHCVMHPERDICNGCDFQQTFNTDSLPILLEKKDGSKIIYAGKFCLLDDIADYWLLQLTNTSEQDKTREIIQKKQLIEYVNNAHEQEKKLLAQELHDGVAQSVYSLLLNARKIKWLESNEEKDQQLKIIDQSLSELLDEIKQLALDLRPPVLDDLGLIPAIRVLIKRLIETTGIYIDFTTNLHQERFDAVTETIIYRVLQECLSNAIKYAEVDEIFINIQLGIKQLDIQIIDYGIGFDTDFPIIHGTGLGLMNMQERVASVDGTLSIRSELGKGTTITAEIPV